MSTFPKELPGPALRAVPPLNTALGITLKIDPEFERKARYAAVGLWAGIVVTSIWSLFIDQSHWESWWFEGAQFLAVMVPIVSWVGYDSRAKRLKHDKVAGYVAGAFILAPIIVPMYVLKTRGWPETRRWALRTAGLLASAIAVPWAAAFVVVQNA